MTKKIIGVDPGTRVTGWGIILFQNNRYTLVDCGTIHPKQSANLEEKYLHIFDELTSVIEIHSPEALSVETQFVDKNVQSAIKLGMARGMAYLAAAKKKIPVFEYAPTKAKQAVTGKGNASKQAVQQMVKILLGLKELNVLEDATDALALAIAHAHFSKTNQLIKKTI
jgi:crossover junction endodeoxyribonuclease RuvC